VNFVNAVSLAKDRGIKIKVAKSSKEEEFVNLIQIQLKTDKGVRVVSGTLSANKQARVVKIDEYYVELSPEGEMIYIENWDRPGLIGNLGTFLGSHAINIAAMTIGRDKVGGKAISLWNVDSAIALDMLEKIKKLENVLTVKSIRI
jgi:D-3-phosphoglycerate dehydrogenase